MQICSTAQTAEYLVPCSTQSQFPYLWSAALRCISWVRSGLEAGWRRVRDEEPLGEVGQSVERSLLLVSSLGNRGVKVLLT